MLQAGGEDQTRSADLRVIAATNRDIQAEVAAARFREDLCYRLHLLPVRVPPLIATASGTAPINGPGGQDVLTDSQFRALKRENTLRALRIANWRIKGADSAAERLGLKPTTLLSRMEKWGIRREEA